MPNGVDLIVDRMLDDLVCLGRRVRDFVRDFGPASTRNESTQRGRQCMRDVCLPSAALEVQATAGQAAAQPSQSAYLADADRQRRAVTRHAAVLEF